MDRMSDNLYQQLQKPLNDNLYPLQRKLPDDNLYTLLKKPLNYNFYPLPKKMPNDNLSPQLKKAPDDDPSLQLKKVPSDDPFTQPKKLPKEKPPKSSIPKHIRAACIRIKYENGIENLKKLFCDNTDAVIQAIEKSPPEMKLTLALALGLEVDLTNYDIAESDKDDKPYFSNPFFDKTIVTQINSRLHASEDCLIDIYESAPQEISVLASAIVHLLDKK